MDDLKTLRDRYGTRGYPTVIYLDPSGEELERMKSRRPRAVAEQFRRISSKWSPAKRLKEVLKGSGDPWDWIRKRVKELGDEDPQP